MTRTALIMAGGTGGHIFPALAVAASLRERGWRIVWLGAPASMEARVVPAHGYNVETVRFGGLRGKGLVAKLLLPTRLLAAFWRCLQVIRRVKPNVVLGMGGYISFPGAMMAALVGKPLVIHEQNQIAGLANRVLARIADRVLAAFPGVLPKAEHTGNPVAGPILQVSEPIRRYAARSGALRLLVVGGSLGAQALNDTVPQALALLAVNERPKVTHQAGEKHIDHLRENYQSAGVEGDLVAFINDMASAYGAADVVLCRAGAMTIAELAAVGVASVLVPYPWAVDDHQTANARYLSDADAAVLIAQAELTPAWLAEWLRAATRLAAAPVERAKADAAHASASPRRLRLRRQATPPRRLDRWWARCGCIRRPGSVVHKRPALPQWHRR